MKAIQFSHFGLPDVLETVELPDPEPDAGQVRIRVKAVGISASDSKIRSGALSFGAPLPQRTGRDVAGIVDATGSDVTDVTVGDRVFGIADDGAAAELCLMTFRAPIPEHLGFVDAAVLPVALETATRGLDQLKVGQRTVLFLNGASGGIGSAAVQLAVARGARVIGAASEQNQRYLTLLGAEPVVYGEGMTDRVRQIAPDGVDVALDVAGNGILDQLIALTGDASKVITLADFAGAKEHGVHFSNGFTDGHAFHAINTVGDLVAAGQFWLPVDNVFTMADIAEAHRLSETGHVRGRIALLVT
ncbi:MAG: NADP-dependent oxidoreductase [Janthinobacterium lividum]